MKRVWIDCDPGVDDALLLALAFHHPEIEVVGVSSVSGNVPLAWTDKNARRLVGFLSKKSLPVITGENKPLLREAVHVFGTHGEDGLGGCSEAFSKYELPPCEGEGISQMAEMLLKEEAITLVAVGPLTNIAKLFLAYPQVKSHISCLYIMGGGLRTGNYTERSEFNFYVDPEAAALVLQSDVPMVMAGLDVTEYARIPQKTWSFIREKASWEVKVFLDALGSYEKEDPAFHDPVALLALTRPEIFVSQDLYVQVDTSDTSSRGQSYADWRRKSREKRKNVKVLLEMQTEAFCEEIRAMFERWEAAL